MNDSGENGSTLAEYILLIFRTYTYYCFVFSSQNSIWTKLRVENKTKKTKKIKHAYTLDSVYYTI